MQEAVLCFVLRGDEVLLIEKRRGLGEGWYNGPGGKLEPGETPLECAVRETREEVGVTPLDPEKVGELTFVHDGDEHTFVHVFRAVDHEGTPRPSPEARPYWVPVDDVPYDEMWDDDHLWLPYALDGRSFAGRFRFEGGDALDEAAFVDYELTLDVGFEHEDR